MWEERAHRARREILALAGAGLGVDELHSGAIRVLGRSVGSELTCWTAMDPETLSFSGMTSGEARIPQQYEPRLARAEFTPDEPHRFETIARRGQTVARSSDLPARERERSLRVSTVWHPLGLDHELRLLFATDGACWGVAGMVRAGADFSDREVEFLAAVAPAVASATRVAARAPAPDGSSGPHAVLVVGPDAALRAGTVAAREWRERLDEASPGRFGVLLQVVVAGARSATSGTFRVRLRDARGRWALVEASRLVGEGDDEVAVTIEPATGDRLTGLLLAAYGLTERERDVCHEVMAGYSTADIAARLFISAHTVQDHLKATFAKVGVRSRGELVARLRPDG